MKLKYNSIALLFLVIVSCSKENIIKPVKTEPVETWNKMAEFPGKGRFVPVSFTIGNIGYFGLGLESTYSQDPSLMDLWSYDPALDQWTQLEDCPLFNDRVDEVFESTPADTSGYILAIKSDKIVEYRPILDDWVFRTTIPMEYRTGRPKIFWFKNNLYTLGLQSGTLYRWDPNDDSWSTSVPYPGSEIYDAKFCNLNDKVIVIISESRSVKVYCFDGNKWTQMTDVPLSEKIYAFNYAAIGPDNLIYLAEGGLLTVTADVPDALVSDCIISNSLWVFDIEKSEFISKQEFEGDMRLWPGSFNINNEIFVTSGVTVNLENMTLEYLTDHWKFGIE